MSDNINDVLNLKTKTPEEKQNALNSFARSIGGFYRFLAVLILISGIIFVFVGIGMDTQTGADRTQKTLVIVGSIFYIIFFTASVYYKAEMIELTAKIEENTRKK